MQTFDQQAYEAWVRQVEDLSPAHVTCPDCNGSGEGECPHCGNTTDCETCDGDGKVRPAQLLTHDFYRRVKMFETQKLEHWVNGDPIATKDERGRRIDRYDPLKKLTEEYQPRKTIPEYPIIKVLLPITEN